MIDCCAIWLHSRLLNEFESSQASNSFQRNSQERKEFCYAVLGLTVYSKQNPDQAWCNTHVLVGDIFIPSKY